MAIRMLIGYKKEYCSGRFELRPERLRVITSMNSEIIPQYFVDGSALSLNRHNKAVKYFSAEDYRVIICKAMRFSMKGYKNNVVTLQ